LLSSEMTLTTVLRASKEPHSGGASPQPLSKSKAGQHPKTVRLSGKIFIGNPTVIVSDFVVEVIQDRGSSRDRAMTGLSEFRRILATQE
jgi:hypothetical protein